VKIVKQLREQVMRMMRIDQGKRMERKEGKGMIMQLTMTMTRITSLAIDC
jgi:hypothetical protein